MVYPLPVVPTYYSSGWLCYAHKWLWQKWRTVAYMTTIKKFPLPHHTHPTFSYKQTYPAIVLCCSPNANLFYKYYSDLGPVWSWVLWHRSPEPIQHATAQLCLLFVVWISRQGDLGGEIDQHQRTTAIRTTSNHSWLTSRVSRHLWQYFQHKL